MQYGPCQSDQENSQHNTGQRITVGVEKGREHEMRFYGLGVKMTRKKTEPAALGIRTDTKDGGESYLEPSIFPPNTTARMTITAR